MEIANKREPLLLLLGDLLILYISLWVMLLLRYLEVPTGDMWHVHFWPFSALFIAWLVVFYIAGLYEKHTIVFRNRLPSIILHTQVINSIIAVLFFYLIPYLTIAPKTNLFIYLIVSFTLILLWRLIIFSRFFYGKQKYHAILIGSGSEVQELRHEVNNNPRYGFKFVTTIDSQALSSIDFETDVLNTVYAERVTLFAIDIRDDAVKPVLPRLYNLIFAGVQFIDNHKVYESIFDRIPLSIINYNWFLENISSKSHLVYDTAKRLTDVAIACVLLIPSLIVYPFVMLAIWLEDRGTSFIAQTRIGQGNRVITLYKFRTMTANEQGGWPGDTESENRVTKVGEFLRKSRIDELPQLWNVLRGDVSLIGPRPDIIGNFEMLSKEVDYYSIRNVVKPGLSGWAQIHQEVPPHTVEETKLRLAYDLYYIKNRSFLLDLKIALQTITTLLRRTGR